MAKPAYLKAKVASKVEDVEVGGGVEGEGVRVEGHPWQPAETGVRTEVPLEHLGSTKSESGGPDGVMK